MPKQLWVWIHTAKKDFSCWLPASPFSLSFVNPSEQITEMFNVLFQSQWTRVISASCNDLPLIGGSVIVLQDNLLNFYFFLASSQKCSPEISNNWVQLRVKLDLGPKFCLWAGHLKNLNQTKGDLCTSSKENQLCSRAHCCFAGCEIQKPKLPASQPTDRQIACQQLMTCAFWC